MLFSLQKEQCIFHHTGATVHDMFNWLSVIVLLPLELIVDGITGSGGYLYHLSYAIVHAIPDITEDSEEVVFLDALTDPLTDMIVQVGWLIMCVCMCVCVTP